MAHPGDAQRALVDQVGTLRWRRLEKLVAPQPTLARALERAAVRPFSLGPGRPGFLLLPAWRPPVLAELGLMGGGTLGPGEAPSSLDITLEVTLVSGETPHSLVAELRATLVPRGPWPEELVLALPPDLAAGSEALELLEASGVSRVRPRALAPDRPLTLGARRLLPAGHPGPYELTAQLPWPLTMAPGTLRIELHPGSLEAPPETPGPPEPPGGPQEGTVGVPPVLLPFGSSRGAVAPDTGGPQRGFWLLPPGLRERTEPTGLRSRLRIVAPESASAPVGFARALARIWAEQGWGEISGTLVLLPPVPGLPALGVSQGGVALVRPPGSRAVPAAERARLAHELAHLLVDGPALGPAPDRLREGLASWLALEALEELPDPAPLRSLRGGILQALQGTSLHAGPGGREVPPHLRGGTHPVHRAPDQDPHSTLADLSAYALQPAALRAFTRGVGQERGRRLLRAYLASLPGRKRGPEVRDLLRFLGQELPTSGSRPGPLVGPGTGKDMEPDRKSKGEPSPLEQLRQDLTRPSTPERRAALGWALYQDGSSE